MPELRNKATSPGFRMGRPMKVWPAVASPTCVILSADYAEAEGRRMLGCIC